MSRPELREVDTHIDRINMIGLINPDEVRKYIALKFKTVNIDLGDICDKDVSDNLWRFEIRAKDKGVWEQITPRHLNRQMIAALNVAV